MLFMTAIGLYTSRLILDVLGEVDYGIYNVVGGFVTVFSIISGTMTTATQRFLAFEIGKGDEGNVRSVFSTSVIVHVILAFITLIVAEAVGVWFINTHMNFPLERYEAANWVFHVSVATFIFSILSQPFNAAIVAYEKMSAFAYISIVDTILKLIIVYLLISVKSDKLVAYSILLAIISILNCALYFFYVNRHFQDCRVERKVEKSTIKEMFSFVGWNMIGAMSWICKEQGVNIILNIYFGATVNAARGIAYQVLGKVNTFSSNFQMALNPQIIKCYSSRDYSSMYKLVYRGSKLSYLLMMTLSLPIIILTPHILDIWLVDVPDYTTIFLQLVLCTSMLRSLSGPLITTMQASGIVRNFQIVVGGVSLFTLPLVVLVLYLGFPPYSAMIVGLVMEVVCLFTRLLMLRQSIQFPVMDFLKNVVFKVLVISVLSAFPPILLYYTLQLNVLSGILIILLSLLSSCLISFYGGLNFHERLFVKEKITIIVRKVLK